MSSKPKNIKATNTLQEPVANNDMHIDKCEIISGVNNDLLNRLIGDVSMPGLNSNEILDKLVDKKLGDTGKVFEDIINDDSKSDEERTLAKTNLDNLKYNIRTALKAEVDEAVMTISLRYKEIVDGIDGITESINTTIANIMLPKCLGAVTPNPATALAESKVFKQQIKSECGKLTSSAIDLICAANKIDFKIPDSIGTILISISSIEKLLEKIPV